MKVQEWQVKKIEEMRKEGKLTSLNKGGQNKYRNGRTE